MTVIVLLGPPGVGKGVLATELEKKYGLKTIAIGDLLRAEVAAGTPLGKQAGPVMARGDLLPDNGVVDLIAHHLAKPEYAKDVIFDGFPRRRSQAEALDKMLAAIGRPVNAVLELQASQSILYRRMIKRIFNAHSAGVPPRKDDNRVTFRRRMDVYRNETMLTIPYYQAQGVLKPIDATQSLDQVLHDVDQALTSPLIVSTPNAPTPS